MKKRIIIEFESEEEAREISILLKTAAASIGRDITIPSYNRRLETIKKILELAKAIWEWEG
jgi:hypothetical protein